MILFTVRECDFRKDGKHNQLLYGELGIPYRYTSSEFKFKFTRPFYFKIITASHEDITANEHFGKSAHNLPRSHKNFGAPVLLVAKPEQHTPVRQEHDPRKMRHTITSPLCFIMLFSTTRHTMGNNYAASVSRFIRLKP